jgi:hypothetical protein
MRIPFLALCFFFLAVPVGADEPADQVERAKLLRELLERPLPPQPSVDAGARELPAARIDIDALQARERLQIQQSGDSAWRQLLSEQQLGRNRASLTGIPSTSAPRALSFEREQRAQDLSMRILQQDLQIRLKK